MQHLFLSYAHLDKPLDQDFHDHFAQRGLRVWHDTNQFGSGSQITRETEAALATLPAAVFLLTGTAVERGFIREVELARAGARKRDDPSFRLIFVLSNIKQEDAEDAVRQHAGLELRPLMYEKLDLPDDVSAAERQVMIGAVCNRVSRSIVADILSAIQRAGRPTVRIGLHTYADDEPSGSDDLNFDWRSLFSMTVPDDSTWANAPLQGVEQAVNLLKAHEAHDIRLHGSANLSAALAFGYAFRPARGFAVGVQQRGEYWFIDERCDADPGLDLVPLGGDGPFESHEWSLEVSVSRDVSPAVDDLVKRRALVVRQRHSLKPVAGPSRNYVRDGQHANAIAARVAQSVAAIRLLHTDACTHLFVAVPMAVAVCIGAHLNKCGPVQGYEYVNETGAYRPSFFIGDV